VKENLQRMQQALNVLMHAHVLSGAPALLSSVEVDDVLRDVAQVRCTEPFRAF
jgi:hypothetical protein